MTSAEVFDLERSRVFDHCWLFVAHECEVPERGDFVTRQVGRRRLIVSRGSDRAVRVWLNSCPHRGAELCRDASGTTTRFTCFYHAWTFDDRGELVTLPDPQSYPDGLALDELGLQAPAQVANHRGFVFVSFDRTAPPLVDYLAGARAYLDLVCDQADSLSRAASHELLVEANWKLMTDNSLDGYHAVALHASFGASLPRGDLDYLRARAAAGEHDADVNAAYALGNGHAVTLQTGSWGRPVARWVPSMGEQAREEVARVVTALEQRHGVARARRIAELDFNLLVFPNLVVNCLLFTIVRTFEPLAPGRTQVRSMVVAPATEHEALRAHRTRSYLSVLGPAGMGLVDDVEAQESCQRGYEGCPDLEWSDVSRGLGKELPDSKDELQMRVFWRRWAELLTGVPHPPVAEASRATQDIFCGP